MVINQVQMSLLPTAGGWALKPRAERDLFCTALLHSLCSFFHMLSPSGMVCFEASDFFFSLIIIIDTTIVYNYLGGLE